MKKRTMVQTLKEINQIEKEVYGMVREARYMKKEIFSENERIIQARLNWFKRDVVKVADKITAKKAELDTALETAKIIRKWIVKLTN